MNNELKIEDCVNMACPWSGKPVSPDSLMLYAGHVVGFCNPGCRDKFASAARAFNQMIAIRNYGPSTSGDREQRRSARG